MDSMAVQGGHQLNGEVSASGAKNAALPIFFATILAEGTHRFSNVPKLKDIESIINTGVYGIAVSGLLTNAGNKEQLVKEINKILYHA